MDFLTKVPETLITSTVEVNHLLSRTCFPFFRLIYLNISSLKNDRVSSTVDVTGENVIIGDGTMSNASNVVKIDMLHNLMITLDRLADSNKSRDTVRIWRRQEQCWKQELMIDRAHVGRVTDLRIFE